MDGIKINGVTLFLGKLPYRKQACFYFTKDGSNLWPAAYVRADILEDVEELWSEMMEGLREG